MTCPHCSALNADDARFCGACGRATSATQPTASPVPAGPPGGETSALIGREIAGRYRILAKLGEGGMGAVYRAEQISLKRTVAVKLLRPEVAGSQLLLRRFNAEAEAVAKLNHPNTVNIYDFGQDTDGTLFIAMEFIEGRSLRSVIQHEAPLPLRRALSIATQVAASLTDAHARAIIHRDLKPDNVMLQDRGKQRDVVRVLDFGIAKLRDENRQSQLAMTQAGDVLGTPQYMAPEQIRGESIDGRADIYALGCMLYEMVTGRLPFEASTVMALLSKHLLESVVPPSQRRPDLALPPAIDQLILGALAKDPAARPPTMEAFDEQIGAILATLPGESSRSAPMAIPTVGGYPSAAGPGSAAGPVAHVAGGPHVGSAPTPLAPLPYAPPAAVGSASAAPSSHAPSASTPVPPYAPGGPVASAPTPAPYDPFAAPYAHGAPLVPHGAAHAPQASPGRKTLWIVLAVLALAGGAAGLFFALRADETERPSASERSERDRDDGPSPGPTVPQPSPQPDPWATPTNRDPDPWAPAPAHGDSDPWAPSPSEEDDDSASAPTPPVVPGHVRTAADLPECEQVARTLERLSRCTQLHDMVRSQLAEQVQSIRATYASVQLRPEGVEYAAMSCRQLSAQLTEQFAPMGCD